eukprot:SRR837773.803.p1 GENE.SRR837773.803~~SRR837773.803.p1  ORF type:complete len:237 (-),score=1.96 SRR837773.803:299-952(-)
MSAAHGGGVSVLEEIQRSVDELQKCDDQGEEFCVPAHLLASRLISRASDVLLSRSSTVSVAADQAVASAKVGLSLGVFQQTTATAFDSTPYAIGALGTPDCFACDLVPLQEDFTLYFAGMDVIGPCRELFSNLLMDSLEALQLSSFQGPQTVVVEPLIANALWRKYSKTDAESLRNWGQAMLIYSYWNEDTSCGLRFGGATRFGDLFDWPSLVNSLR